MMNKLAPDTAPKKLVFVLMPFDKNFDEAYELAIKAACNQVGAVCERADKAIFDKSIIEYIYMQISKADVIVADMTGNNANVFYEVGYAHALNKKVILLNDGENDIPFDLQNYPHIEYKSDNIIQRDLLIEKLDHYIRSDVPIRMKSNLFDYYIENGAIENNSHFEFFPNITGDGKEKMSIAFSFNLKIYNNSGMIINPDCEGWSVSTKIIDMSYQRYSKGNSDFIRHFESPSREKILWFRYYDKVFPKQWAELYINANVNLSRIKMEGLLETNRLEDIVKIQYSSEDNVDERSCKFCMILDQDNQEKLKYLMEEMNRYEANGKRRKQILCSSDD